MRVPFVPARDLAHPIPPKQNPVRGGQTSDGAVGRAVVSNQRIALCGSAKRNLTLGFITAKLNWENSVVVPNGPTFTSMSTQTVERDSEF